MKLREADVVRLPMADPGDVSALAALLGARTSCLRFWFGITPL
jgi:hypothetical protein